MDAADITMPTAAAAAAAAIHGGDGGGGALSTIATRARTAGTINAAVVARRAAQLLRPAAVPDGAAGPVHRRELVTQFAVMPAGATMNVLMLLEAETWRFLDYLSPSAGEHGCASCVASVDGRSSRSGRPRASPSLGRSRRPVPAQLDIDLVEHRLRAAACRRRDAPPRSTKELLRELADLLKSPVWSWTCACSPTRACPDQMPPPRAAAGPGHQHRTIPTARAARLDHKHAEQPILRLPGRGAQARAAHRGLNETYNGGLGSFALLVLVYFFAAASFRRTAGPWPTFAQSNITVGNCCSLFDYFGRLFDYVHFGISLRLLQAGSASCSSPVPLFTLTLRACCPGVDLGRPYITAIRHALRRRTATLQRMALVQARFAAAAGLAGAARRARQPGRRTGGRVHSLAAGRRQRGRG